MFLHASSSVFVKMDDCLGLWIYKEEPMVIQRHTCTPPRKHETLTQWWPNIGPTSLTAGQYWAGIGSTYRVCWAVTTCFFLVLTFVYVRAVGNNTYQSCCETKTDRWFTSLYIRHTKFINSTNLCFAGRSFLVYYVLTIKTISNCTEPEHCCVLLY